MGFIGFILLVILVCWFAHRWHKDQDARHENTIDRLRRYKLHSPNDFAREIAIIKALAQTNTLLHSAVSVETIRAAIMLEFETEAQTQAILSAIERSKERELELEREVKEEKRRERIAFWKIWPVGIGMIFGVPTLMGVSLNWVKNTFPVFHSNYEDGLILALIVGILASWACAGVVVRKVTGIDKRSPKLLPARKEPNKSERQSAGRMW